MVMVLNRDQNDLRLYKVNPGSTVARLVYSEKSDAWLSPSAYQMVDYGDKTFVIGSERSGYRHLYEYDYNGNLRRTLTSGEWNVTDYYGRDPQTGTAYIRTTQLGAINRNLASVDLKGKVTLLNNQPGTETAWFSKDCKYYLRSYSDALTPPVYTICDNKGKTLVEVENNAAYAAKYASAPKKEFLRIPNAAGQEMNAFMIKPIGFDRNKNIRCLCTSTTARTPRRCLTHGVWKASITWRLRDMLWWPSTDAEQETVTVIGPHASTSNLECWRLRISSPARNGCHGNRISTPNAPRASDGVTEAT